MLKRATKGQIIKKINIQDSFERSGVFYIPIVLDKNACEFFNISNIITTFLPANFIKSFEDSSDFDKDKNSGFTKQEKPLFIKDNTKNSNYFNSDNIENSSTNSLLYKKVYSKNIVSSFGQLEFLEDKIPVISIDEDNDEIDLLARTSIDKIRQKTCITRLVGFDEFTQCYNMVIKVYALNNKEEVVDSLEINSKPIDKYDNVDDNSIDLILESDFDLFVNDYTINFRPYITPILKNINENKDINGPTLNFNDLILNSIFLNTEDIDNINVTLSSDLIGKSLLISRLTSSITPSEVTQNKSISRSLIEDEGFINFILDAKKYIDENNKESLDIEYNFNISRRENEINSFKTSSISKTIINQLYQNILSYNFEKDLTSERVISLQISKLNKNLVQNIENIYKIKIDIDTENYLEEQILQNSISFNFFDDLGNKITSIEDFYFDDSISESNKISGTLINLDSLFFNQNSATIFIQNKNAIEQNLIKSCELILHSEISTQPFSIGIFDVIRSSYRTNRQRNNVFNDCPAKIGNNISINFDPNNYLYNLLIQRTNTVDSFILNLGNILGDISFKNIEYFSSSTNESEAERLNEVINNTLVKITKYIKINNLQLNEASQYYFLNEVTSELTSENRVTINTSVVDIMNFDLQSKLLSNLKILNNYNNIVRGNYEEVEGNFDVEYKICLDFAVLKNNTAIKFGNINNNDQSKSNLINFITSSNRNFQISSLINIIDRIYSDTFFENKRSLIEEIYVQSNIVETIDFEQRINASVQDFLTSDITPVNNEINSNIFTSEIENIDDFNFVNVENIRSNILLDIDKRSFLLKKADRRKKLLSLSGNNINYIIDSFNHYENSSILRSFCKVEYKFNNKEFSENEINSLNNAGFQVIKSNIDQNCMFLFNKDSENSLPVSVSIRDNNIFCDIIRENRDFKKFSSNLYYDQIASLIGQSNSLIIKNIILRFCIVFNINGNHNILLFNTDLGLQPSRKLTRYINNNSSSYELNYLNLDVIDENKKLYKPSIIYKGSSI